MDYGLVIIGGGPAGYLAAERASHAGIKTLVIERENVGGVCLNEGCVPTKTLLYSAKLYDGAVGGKKYGVTVSEADFDHGAVIKRKEKVIKLLTNGIKSTLKTNGAELVTGTAVICGKNEDGRFVVRVNDSEYTAEKLLIATGSSPAMPKIPGLHEGYENGFVLTNREILKLTAIPESLAVIGGGVIGLEMASYFNSVGTKVTVVEMLDHIAGENDRDLTELLKKNYERKGIIFKLGAKVTEIGSDFVTYELNGETESLFCEKVLLSIGRRPNTSDIGLETIGVELQRGAIVTDLMMRTNATNVYAAGDVNGRSMLAHTAYREAEVAVNNMLGIEDSVRYDAIPAAIYTNPELGSVGYTEAEAQKAGMDIKAVKIPMRYSGRYLAENEGGDGIFKLIVESSTGRIIGAHALCNYASEFIVAAGIMITMDMTVEQAKKVVFPHPTVCEIIREAVFQCS